MTNTDSLSDRIVRLPLFPMKLLQDNEVKADHRCGTILLCNVFRSKKIADSLSAGNPCLKPSPQDVDSWIKKSTAVDPVLEHPALFCCGSHNYKGPQSKIEAMFENRAVGV